MKIVFERITIENFLSIGYANINFRNRGYTLVSGVNNNPLDSAKSNGSGKSSVFEAISYALTGETIRGVKDVVNMYGDDGACVELVFTVDGKEYTLRRSKEHGLYKTDLKIYIDGKDVSGKGIRDSQKLLEEYLPDVTSSLVGSVILLGQGLPQRFTNNTPSGRKDVLEKLSKSDFMIEDLKNRLNNRKSCLSSELRNFEDKELNATTKLHVLSERQLQLENRLKSMSPIGVYEQAINKCQADIVYFTKEIIDAREYIESTEAKLEEYRIELTDIKKKYNDKLIQDTQDINEVINNNKVELATIRSSMDTLSREITKAKSIKDVCPTCGQKIQGVILPDTSEMEAQWGVLKSRADLLYSSNQELEHNIDHLKTTYRQQEDEECVKLDDLVRDLKASLNKSKLELTKVQAAANEAEKELATHIANRDSYSNTIKTLQEDIENCKHEAAKEQENLVYNTNGKNVTQEKLDAVSKMITVTTRDFRGFLLTNVIQFIDKQAKSYCRDIFDTDNIEFALDGNNISIKYCNKQYETLSGGEKQKVDLIVQFAIRDMLCQFLDFRCNIIALDEIFDNLDAKGCEKVIQLISRKLTDIESIFIITHHSDISIPVDSHITLVKNERGTSYVQNN